MKTEINHSLTQCWDCNASGAILLAFPPLNGPSSIKCSRCDGSGWCPAIMREWQTTGTRMRTERLGVVVTLRDRARQLGISPTILSNAERGIIDPSTIIT